MNCCMKADMMKSRSMERYCWILNILGLMILSLASACAYEPMLLLFLAIGVGSVILTAGGLVLGSRWQNQQSLIPVFLITLASLGMLVSIAGFHWPLRLSYAWSQSSLNKIASDVRAGNPIKLPLQTGLLTIRQVEISPHNIVCLWTEPHPAGSRGFVQTGPIQPPFNLSAMINLDEDWQFISED